MSRDQLLWDGPRFHATGQGAWVPGEAVRARSRLLAALSSWGMRGLEELHAESIRDPEWFWRAVVDDLDVTFDEPF